MIAVDMSNLNDDETGQQLDEGEKDLKINATDNKDSANVTHIILKPSTQGNIAEEEHSLLPNYTAQRGLNAKIPNNDYHSYVKKLRMEGRQTRSDFDGNQPKFSDKPEWLNESLLENVKSVHSNHFMAINFAHLTGLLLLVRVDSIHRTLKATGESINCAKLFRRYYDTMIHVKKWYEGDLLKSGDAAQRSLQIVRGMHNKVSAKFNDNHQSDDDSNNNQVQLTCPFNRRISTSQSELNANNIDQDFKHISQYDLMITQFAFIGFIVTHPRKVGLLDNFNRNDLESLLHFWRLIGHYLGASGPYNLCAYELEDVIGLCKALNELEYKESISKRDLTSEHGLMSLNIARSVKFIPLITFYGMMKHAYSMLDHDDAELDAKKTSYSSLSYYFIDLVMSNFLAYKPLRAFNNGLIRFSIYLVGKFDNWFTSHLESSYGPELQP